MKGVILAAGKGTRLYPVTLHIPKPLLPIANRITMEYAFDRLKEMQITEICVVVGETGPAVQKALGDGSDFGVRLSYVRQSEPKGLAHAVGFTQEFVGTDSFALYLGDAIYGGEGFAGLADKFKRSECANLSLVKPVADPSRFGVATLEGERIVGLEEKPSCPKSNFAMAGLYFFGPQIWSVLSDLSPSGRGEYEITDAIQLMIDRGESVLAGIFDGEWFDTGTLNSFLETSRFLTGGEALIASSATTKGDIGGTVVIGDKADVVCQKVEDSVILPGAQVRVDGTISRSIIGGRVECSGDVQGQVMYDS